jgi:hypothetical protein
VINFFDWPVERAARYEHPFARVVKLVKPERDSNRRQGRRENWWKYGERAPELYQAISAVETVLAMSLVSNALLPVRLSTGPVFAHKCCVFAVDDFASLAVLSSAAHQVWALRYTSTLGAGINYSPSDVFLTLPRPQVSPRLHELGEELDGERREVMLGRALGLTKLYNQVHNPAVTDAVIVRLREIHEQIDLAVLEAYDWGDLDPQIGHHPTKIGVRWTVSPQARFELLDRLLVENHRRAELQS